MKLSLRQMSLIATVVAVAIILIFAVFYMKTTIGPEVNYNYKIIIMQNTTENYYVWIPAPDDVDGNVQPENLLASFNVEPVTSNVLIKYADTPHGKALNISGQGNMTITLALHGNPDTYGFYSSMTLTNMSQSDASSDCWLFSNKALSINGFYNYSHIEKEKYGLLLDQHVTYGDSVYYRYGNNNLDAGWNKITLVAERVVT